MAQVRKPTAFAAADVPSGSHLNNNFDTLYNEFNGNIDSANLKSDRLSMAKVSGGFWNVDASGNLIPDTGFSRWIGSPSLPVAISHEGVLKLVGTTSGGVTTHQPFIQWLKDGVRRWEMGLDVANSVIEDFYIARDIGAGVSDIVYLREYLEGGNRRVAIGLNFTPPPSGARVSISGADNSAWHDLLLRVAFGQTGDALKVTDSGGASIFDIDATGKIGYAASNTTGTAGAQEGFLLVKVAGTVKKVPYHAA
ncbi:MAG TPA: hypothetical protein VF226_04810 [Hyphomicrobiaceae bacterium]